jgi:general secretion pathway protein E
VQAALTGHQVFSTVHTNSSAGAAPRLLDMGVEPFLLSSALNAVLGQRVVRKICQYCRTTYSPPPEILDNIKTTLSKLTPQNIGTNIKLYKGKGCQKCNNTGYLGRVGIFEVLVVSSNMARLILERATLQEIEKAAISEGMITMKQDGYLKVLEGVTTMEEVLRVAQD